MKEILRLIEKYPLTAGYKYDKDDIFIEYDGYLCIIQTNTCNNIIFIKMRDEHKYTLRKDFEAIIKHAIVIYNKWIFLLRNKKWKALLERTGLVKLMYENEEYCIYGKKDLY